MKRTTLICTWTALLCLVAAGAQCPNDNKNNNSNDNSNDNNSNGNGNTNGNNNSNDNLGERVTLYVTKLNPLSTTTRGPAVGDGVLAFNTDGNSTLSWVKPPQTSVSDVPVPNGMEHDETAFQFAGKKLIMRDRNSGDLFVFDTETEDVAAMPDASINMGGSNGPNLWEASGHTLATVNATTTTQDGAGRRIKIVDISDVNHFVITALPVDPGADDPDAISIDEANSHVLVRAGGVFFLYDLTNPNDPPFQFDQNLGHGGTGSTDVRISGDSIAFFDDDSNFTILGVSDGTFTPLSRNPGRSNVGFSFVGNKFAYFAAETADDGSDISNVNRMLVGSTDNLNTLVDPSGEFINGASIDDGRLGFGLTSAISPNGKWVFVAGATPVDVGLFERLAISVDGGAFQPIADTTDQFNALRASGVAASDNVVAFLVPTDPNAMASTVNVAYAGLPPP